MTRVPRRPKVFHITHVQNLPRIVASEKLWSDAKRIEMGLHCELVGLTEIKRRRLEELDVHCHPGTKVGQYVPFYFCPRSIMLYILYRANNPELTYRGGQGAIIHLQADLHETVRYATRHGLRWAFSDRNAGASFAQFFDRVEHLDKINWAAVDATDFRDPLIKEGKQAEFLVFDSFPWTLVEKIGIARSAVLQDVEAAMEGASHLPRVSVARSWYY